MRVRPRSASRLTGRITWIEEDSRYIPVKPARERQAVKGEAEARGAIADVSKGASISSRSGHGARRKEAARPSRNSPTSYRKSSPPGSDPLPLPHLQIRQGGPDIALGPFGDLAGDPNRSCPPPREELRENLVFRGLETDRLEPGLESFGQAAKIEVRGAEKRLAGLHPVEVGQQQVLRVLRAAVQFVDHLDRPRAEDRPVAKVARPVAGESDFPAVHVPDCYRAASWPPDSLANTPARR